MSELVHKCKTTVKKASKRIIGEKNTHRLGQVYRSIRPKREEPARKMVDVCFINGCDQSVPHPPRYRVTHQREQLEHNNITTSEIFYTEVQEFDVKYANAFVIFRCPYTDAVGDLINAAHKLHKPVYYDIDDLVIDTKYTDRIPYVQTLTVEEKELYDDGVNRMGKTLKMCDGAITTTQALADELSHYVPEVLVNRNNSSDEMYGLSLQAIELKNQNYYQDVVLDSKQGIIVPKREQDEFRIGYFSGSITHNADIELIKPALLQVLSDHQNVKLYLVGELDLPVEFQPYSSQIVVFPFMDWKKLPSLISMVDVNLGPIEDTIFNRAKSENKWVEAAMVQTVTVASNVGAFAEMIQDGTTGFLADDTQWHVVLEKLINDPSICRRVAKDAFEYVKEHCLTIHSGKKIADFFRERLDKTCVCVLPSTEISGGIMVALKHMDVLYRNGWNVTIVASNPSLPWLGLDEVQFPVLYWEREAVEASFAKGIATMWTTVSYLESHYRIKQGYYLVQNYETEFYQPAMLERQMADRTYALSNGKIKYVTISKWCQEWLENQYGQSVDYCPNGIEIDNFACKKRLFEEIRRSERKCRILIEGDSAVAYKGVDDSFKVIDRLDPNRFEVWYMSYNAGAKEWYRVDKFLHRVPYSKVGEVYGQCDILLKSSTLESFSYPPLEMMATGGAVVVVQNGGNKEYLRDYENCLFYPSGDIDAGVAKIHEVIDNPDLYDHLYEVGRATAEARDWKAIEQDILKLYDIV